MYDGGDEELSNSKQLDKFALLPFWQEKFRCQTAVYINTTNVH